MQHNPDYGEIVYTITNEEILKTKAKDKKVAVILLCVCTILFFIVGFLGLNGFFESETEEVQRNLTIFCFGFPVFAFLLMIFKNFKDKKTNTDELCTYVYEKGLYINQGKPFEINFSDVTSVQYSAGRRGNQYNIYINTNDGKRNYYLIGPFGIKVCTDLFTLYTEIDKSFTNYKNNIEQK